MDIHLQPRNNLASCAKLVGHEVDTVSLLDTNVLGLSTPESTLRSNEVIWALGSSRVKDACGERRLGDGITAAIVGPLLVEERESCGEICLGLCAVYGGKEDVDVWGDRCLSDLAMGFAAT